MSAFRQLSAPASPLTTKSDDCHGPATAVHTYLVDQQGRILAQDGPLDDSAIGQPALHAAVQRVFDGAAEATVDLVTDQRLSQPPFALARVRRLLGEAGPLALVELLPATPAVAPQRRDPLTRLADRSAIDRRIDEWRRGAPTAAARFAVLFLDLDDFKQVNDRHGHAAGDQVLKELALRWQRCVRDDDLVARYGGDEFVALIHGSIDAPEVDRVVERLRRATAQPFALLGARQAGSVSLSVTIGVAICCGDDRSTDDLLAAADRDMYAQKRRALAAAGERLPT